MRRVSKTRALKGFTLVELQIALLLVALMAALLVGALRLSAQTWNKVTGLQDQSEHHFLLSRLLRKHLSNMRFVRVRNDSNELMSSFLGSSDQLYFVAPFPSFNNDGELYWWQLKSQWQEDVKSYQLVLNYFPYLPGEPVIIENNDNLSYLDQQPSSLIVADNIQLSSLEYYSRDASGVEAWGEQWQPNTATPLVVRFTLIETASDGTEIELPEIAVAPRFASQQLHAVSGGR